MKIGLIRHFKVNNLPKKFMTSKDFVEWVVLYDNADVILNEMDIKTIEWNKCYTSDLPRAIKTAEAIFNGEVITMPELREVPLYPVFKTNLKLPYIFWSICGRAAWLFSHKSQAEGKKQTEKRVKGFLDNIEDKTDINILLVSHGFLIYSFQKELVRRGFQGDVIKSVRNGVIYIFEK